MNAIRLRYRIENAQQLREHFHLVDGAAYFFFPDRRASAPQGMVALLEVDFSASDESMVLRGLVWSRPASGGLWLELPDAARALDRLERAPHERENRRLGSDHLVVAQAEGHPALLCRLRDLSAGGARIAGTIGQPGDRVRVASADDESLIMNGTVIWSGPGATGIAWDRADLRTRSNLLRLLEDEDDEWTAARSEAHPASCRCGQRAARPIVLLG